MITDLDTFQHPQFSFQYGFKYRRVTTDIPQEEQKMQLNTVTHNTIFFQIEGELEISWDKFTNVLIKPGELYFLPRGANVTACIKGTEVTYIAARLDHDLDNQHTFNKLHKYTQLQQQYTYTFEPLPIRRPLDLFVESLKCYIIDDLQTKQLQNAKLIELYVLFRKYYSKQECANLFHPVLRKSSKFKTFILDNFQVTVSIEELAQKANMSRSTFDRNFKENFGMPPRKWIDMQTGILIMRRAAEPNVSIKDIMYEVGVYNPSQFTQLCKRVCGVLPSELVRR